MDNEIILNQKHFPTKIFATAGLVGLFVL